MAFIADSHIKHVDQTKINTANSVSFEKYNRLGNVNVVDSMEQPPTVLTLPDFLQERLLYEPFLLDKYSKSFYFFALRIYLGCPLLVTDERQLRVSNKLKLSLTC